MPWPCSLAARSLLSSSVISVAQPTLGALVCVIVSSVAVQGVVLPLDVSMYVRRTAGLVLRPSSAHAQDGPLKPCEFGGTTALVALRIGEVLYMAHAGDSCAVLASDGKALRLTVDHKPDRPDECARVWVRPRFLTLHTLRHVIHLIHLERHAVAFRRSVHSPRLMHAQKGMHSPPSDTQPALCCKLSTRASRRALLCYAQAAGGRIMESRNRVVSAPKEHGKRVTLLAMTRCGPACAWVRD